jgi:hypothetical protein
VHVGSRENNCRIEKILGSADGASEGGSYLDAGFQLCTVRYCTVLCPVLVERSLRTILRSPEKPEEPEKKPEKERSPRKAGR